MTGHSTARDIGASPSPSFTAPNAESFPFPTASFLSSFPRLIISSPAQTAKAPLPRLILSLTAAAPSAASLQKERPTQCPSGQAHPGISFAISTLPTTSALPTAKSLNTGCPLIGITAVWSTLRDTLSIQDSGINSSMTSERFPFPSPMQREPHRVSSSAPTAKRCQSQRATSLTPTRLLTSSVPTFSEHTFSLWATMKRQRPGAIRRLRAARDSSTESGVSPI